MISVSIERPRARLARTWAPLFCLLLAPCSGCYGDELEEVPQVQEVGAAATPGAAQFLEVKRDEGEWSCLGSHMEWPEATSDTVRYAGRIVDFMTLVPLPDVYTRVCAFEDFNCDHPLDENYSDADGVFSVMVPTHTISTGNHGFDGYLEMSGGGIFPTLTFPNPPREPSAASSRPTSPAHCASSAPPPTSFNV